VSLGINAREISTDMCDASRYATTPSFTAGQTLEQSQGFGSITLNPGIDKFLLRSEVLHSEIE
jgi:hypothetical protein